MIPAVLRARLEVDADGRAQLSRLRARCGDWWVFRFLLASSCGLRLAQWGFPAWFTNLPRALLMWEWRDWLSWRMVESRRYRALRFACRRYVRLPADLVQRR